jgi:hypothetical protein
VALRVGERPPLDAVQDPILPVPGAAERLDPGRGDYQVGGTEVQEDPNIPLLRFGDAAQKSAIRSASCASIVM